MSPPLSLADGAEFYSEMLADVLQATSDFARRLDLEPVVAFHPPDAAHELIHRAPEGFRLHAQRGADLGERMAHAVEEAAAAGASRILIRGSDSPVLSLEGCEEAIDHLDAGCDLVLAPDQGGGYALVGMRRPQPGIFSLSMSTEEVLRQTLDRAQELGLRTATTQPTFDLDTVEDFRRLAELSPSIVSDLCPRTVESFQKLTESGVL